MSGEAIIIILLILAVLAVLFVKVLLAAFGVAGGLLDSILGFFRGSRKRSLEDILSESYDTAHRQRGEQPNSYWDNPYYSPAMVMPDHQRDPKRRFDKEDFHAAARLANYRCEYVDSMGHRCNTGGTLHGDHWFPHSRGGATVYDPTLPLNPFENNLVILCEECNMAKSNIPPTQEETIRLENSRAQYGVNKYSRHQRYSA